MSNYYIKAILLENCPYSINAEQLLKIHSIPCKITWVNQNNKQVYKTDSINTFPQIYLNKINSPGNLLLGGHDDLASFITTFKAQKLNDKNINDFMTKYSWSKKATLRFIQLINLH